MITLLRFMIFIVLIPNNFYCCQQDRRVLDMKLIFNFQHYSFKERGARNALLSLTEEQKKNGVVSASMGNHSQVSILSYLNFYKLFHSP